MALSTEQRRDLWETLREALTPPRLRELLLFGPGKQLQDISMAGDFRAMVFDVLDDAERAGYTLRLLDAARLSLPGNERLWKLAQQLKLTSATPAHEKIVHQNQRFIAITQWRTRLAAIEAQVCRVEAAGAFGTGFLIGPDLMMTNYHVVEDVLKQPNKAGEVVCRFDYRALEDGTTINPGTVIQLDQDAPFVDHSEYSPLDGVEGGGVLPAADQLDYALLHLATRAGSAPSNPKDINAPPRGWFMVPAGPVALAIGDPLHILQHPDSRPLELALDTDAILGVNGNGTRVRYRTNTEPGSSGAPCCDASWNLVALHHVGDPKYGQFSKKGDWNQGIPFDAIVKLLRSRGLGHLLNQAQPAS